MRGEKTYPARSLAAQLEAVKEALTVKMDALGFRRLIPLLVICLGLLLPGCISNQEATFPVPEVTGQTIVPLTITPEDTSTPSGKIQFPTQALFAAKDILIVYGQQEGDAAGDHFQDLMYVLNEPIVVIYSDGQALIQRDNWFVEEWLSETQLCDLYARLRESMEASKLADRYSTRPTPEICISGCGGPSFYLRIAGGDSYLSHTAAVGEIMYLSPEFRLPLEIISGFANSPFKDRFKSDRVAIWYELIQRIGYLSNHDPFPIIWPEYPDAFLALEPFIGNSEAGFIIVEGLDSIDLQHRYSSMPTIGVHRENNRDYVLILRPMLPHEGVNDLMEYLSIPSPASSSNLGLSCVQ